MAASPAALIMMLIFSTASFATLVTFSTIQSIPNNGIFNHTQASIGMMYPTNINPASYAFSIWFVIFLFQLAWIGYAFSTACRTNNKGLVMVNPVVLPKKFHVAYILACCATTSWCFIIDRELLLASALVLIAATVLGSIALFINLIATAPFERKMLYADLVCIRVLVQNGISLFFSWCTVASVLSVTIALAYDPNSPHQFSPEDAASLCLYSLGVIVVMWSILENTVLFRLTRYVYAWYAVLIWALTAIIVENPDTNSKNTIITIVLLSVSVVCLAIKITVFALKPTAGYRKAKKYTLIDEE